MINLMFWKLPPLLGSLAGGVDGRCAESVPACEADDRIAPL